MRCSCSAAKRVASKLETMTYRHFRARHVAAHITTLICLILLLASCSVEGGVPEIPPTSAASPQPQKTDSAYADKIAQRSNTWTLGLTEQPHGLSPYQPSANDERRAAPVVELLFPSPILAVNYTYTTTGVLQQVPTLENGGATLRKADVYLDASGVITTTATQVITQADQLVITYRWNPGLKWSDGTPVTAADSVFAYEHAKAKPPSDDAQGKLERLVSYTALDEHTTQAVLQPDVTGQAYFMNYWTPLPRHLLEKATPEQWQAFEQKPIGYGPYMIEQRETGAIRMVRNPHYFGATPANPHFDVLFAQNVDLLRANIANGNLDVISTDRLQSEDIAALDKDNREKVAQVEYAPSPIWEHIDFNLDVQALQDFHVRRAIAFGTNRAQMAKDLLGGHTQVLDSWVLPNQPEAAPPDQITRYEYNPDQARKLLDDAGYADTDGDGIRASPDGVTLTLQLLTTADSPLRQAVADRFKTDMRAIGIDVEVTTADSNSLFAPDGPLYQRQFELALYGWKSELNAGGLSLWNCNAVPSADNNFTGENFAGWCFRDADRAIRRGATALDMNERRAEYLKQQQLWTQELPALPLFQRLSAIEIAPAVEGPKADSFAPITWNVARWQRR